MPPHFSIAPLYPVFKENNLDFGGLRLPSPASCCYYATTHSPAHRLISILTSMANVWYWTGVIT